MDNSNASWAKVKTAGGTVGYCSKEYLTIQVVDGGGSSGGSSSKPSSSSKPTSSSSNQLLLVPSLPLPPVLLPGSSGTNPSEKLQGKVTDNLNLRSGAGTNYSILLTIPKGSTITVLDNTNSSWYKVSYNGKTGYCSSQYIDLTDKEEKPDPEEPDSKILGAKVTADSLRVRSGPGTNYSIVTSVSYGTMLTVLDTSNAEWYKIQTGGKTGYVSSEYVELIYSDGTITGTLSLSQTTGSIPLGKTLYIKANTSSSVLWTSSNSSVAVVENGYIRATGKGTAVITAVSGNAKGTCTVP